MPVVSMTYASSSGAKISWFTWISALTARYHHGARWTAFLLTAALNILLLTFQIQVCTIYLSGYLL
jgi:hypothetical protein